MKIVKVGEIKSNPINEQIYDLSGIVELAASIDEVGLLQSITENQSHTINSGHRRLEAIKSLGRDEVSVEVIKTRKDTEAALIVHYNKQREKSCQEILNEYRVLQTHSTTSCSPRSPQEARTQLLAQSESQLQQ